MLLAGCSGSGGNPTATNTPQAADTSTTTSAPPAATPTPVTSTPPAAATPTPVKSAPTISGEPLTALNFNTAYTFVPTVASTTGGTLTFAIQNKPAWATFDASTGVLAGTPNGSNVGNYNGVVISVSNGVATAALPAFNISVTQFSNGTVTISWLPPTTNTNGTTLTNLAGYKIYYGTSPSSLTHSVQITSPGIADYVIDNLSPATWYFSLVSYNSAAVESPLSAIVSKTISS